MVTFIGTFLQREVYRKAIASLNTSIEIMHKTTNGQYPSNTYLR